MKTYMYKYLFSNNKPIIQSYFQSILRNNVNVFSYFYPVFYLNNYDFVATEDDTEDNTTEDNTEEQEIDIDITQIYNSISEDFEYNFHQEKQEKTLELYDIYIYENENENENENNTENPMMQNKNDNNE